MPANAIRYEGNLLAIRRPGCVIILSRIVGEILRLAAIGVHDVDFVVAVTVAGEGDLFAVGRPDGPVIHDFRFGYASDIAAVGIHDVDFLVAGGGNVRRITKTKVMNYWP